MDQSQLHITIVSQENKLLETKVDSITAETTEGEVTILPHHISLFTQLQPGELIYRNGNDDHSFVVSKGFMDVNQDNTVTVMVDSAVAARNISVEKAQEAVRQARETMEHSQDRHELLLAEASLKQAMLEIKIAQKTKKTTI
jgi:F-type H+-transporting ATPase subunit epsilon